MPRPPESPKDEPPEGVEPRTDRADSPSEVGQQLSLAQEHLRGMHAEPRPDCWRCMRSSQL